MAKATQELKYKRLKVGHACYVCRTRGRNCQSSNPETQAENDASATSDNQDEADSSTHSNVDSDDDSILFSRSKPSISNNRSMPKFSDTWTSDAATRTTAAYSKSHKLPIGEFPTFGSFVRWRPEPALPSKYSTAIEMPSSDIQMHLINHFFETRYKVSPIIPKRYFYEQLRTKGPLITPLLLNAIYCIVSSSSSLKDVPKSIVFFNRAKRLLDDFLDVPRVSTVAALCLLSLYEPVPTKSKSAVDQHCRSWMYSGMAFRMCLELGLNMDTPYSRDNMPSECIELRRRVFWSCYCLDKMQSAEWERLWAIPSSLAKTALPQILPQDDEAERWIVQTFQQKIKLALLGEEGLQIRASFAIRDDIDNGRFYEQLDQYRAKLLHWSANLPLPDIWNVRSCATVEEVMNEPRKPPEIGYFLTLYYFMLSDTLFCLPDNAKTSIQHRIYAAQLTRCVESTCDKSTLVVRYEFLAHALIAAIRVHARYLSDQDSEVAGQSLYFFNLCVKLLRKLQHYAIIPECTAVLQKISAIHQHSRMHTVYSDASLSKVNPAAAAAINAAATLDSTPHHYANNMTYQQMDANGNMVQFTPEPQQPQQPQAQMNLVDPYRTNVPHNGTFEYQNMDSMLGSSPFNNLAAFGSSIGVDFGDRRQLWEFALDASVQQSYEFSGSAPSTPEDTMNNATFPPATAATANSEWSSPCGPSDFIWPDPIISHTPPPQVQHPQPQQYHLTTSPHQQHHINSMLVYQNMSHINNNPQPTTYIQPSQQQQQQQQMNVNIHHPTPTLHQNLCYPLSHPVVHVPQHAYYPN
ncbi:Zn(2)-C6 fungal-specific transcription factor [Mucor lusitanicus CBS 277.49]|uniref:Zn(2)-C6 fungal-specific transcription factor n=1 Tax=Mucor lusitanicus CBS 277.49 TaxID=747725 RepID=A0A162TYR2_MUCCL|nr:Zn(2)-C6 fungal-specific transcription factor [Mucor lusitanicus CBS 277.49]